MGPDLPRVRRESAGLGSGGFKSSRGFVIGALEEVTVDVVGCANGGGAGAPGDDEGAFSGGDEEGDVGVAEVMWSHGFSNRVVRS